MRKIISVFSLLGITIGVFGTRYSLSNKNIVDKCGGYIIENGIQHGHTGCRMVYGISPWIWVFASILAIGTIGLFLSLMTRRSKRVH